MTKRSTTIAKITRPKIRGICLRKRLFQRMDAGKDYPVTWVTGPPGSGKTTLVASYLDTRKIPYLWYQVDSGDADIATFFYYMGMAAKKAFPGKRKPLPVLTPEYLSDISSFTRRYFEELYGKLKPPFIIVFDNYQDAPDESNFHGVISAGLSMIPEGIHVIVVSRNEPLPALSRLRANNGIHFIGWNELRLTLEESREIVRMKDRKSFTNKIIADLHEKTDGWAAGLVLMVEIAKTKDVGRPILKELTPQEIFDYFANEVIEKTDRQTQTFLLKTAFLPRMTAAMAEKLTGVNNAEQILSDLNKKHYFTTQYGYHEQGAALHNQTPSGVQEEKKKSPHAILAYQYHPLFREFLLSRAKGSYNREELSQTKRCAAGVLEASGMVEDAAVLLRDDRDWDGLAKLILDQAASMSAQGRNKTLEEWLQNLPRDMLENTPWLLYWLGVCRLPVNPDESRRYFDDAFRRFHSQADQTGMWLSWSYAVDIIFYAWEDISPLDKYAEIFQDIYRKETPFPSPAVESRVVSCRFIIMMLRQMHHPEISEWAERVFMLVKKSHDANFRLQIGYYPAIYYYWTGDFVKMHIVINALHKDIESEAASPLLSIFGMATEALYDFISGSVGSCLRIVSDALKLAQKTGVHIWDTHLCGHGTFAALSVGDIITASDLMGKIEPALSTARKIDVGYYHSLSSWKSLLEGDMPSAARHAEIATSVFVEIGTPFPVGLCHFLEAQALFELGKTGEAEARINLVRQIVRRLKSKHLEFMCLIADAQFALDMRTIEGKKCWDTDIGLRIADLKGSNKHPAIQNQKSEMVKHGLDALRRAMELGREQGYVNMVGWRNEVMAELCVKALEAGIEVEYAKSLVRKRNLIPDVPPIQCEDWPWPVKIFTLGRFVILHDDKPLQSAGKVQHKPLEMLRVILSHRDGEVSEARLIDVLWPDTEGDTAYHAYEAALHRLRRLLGADGAVRRQGRQVSLDKRYCWVDAWAFERMVEPVERSATSLSMNPQSAGPVVRRDSSLCKNLQFAGAEALRLAEKAIGAYKGHFLPADTDHPWTAAYREQLQDKFRRLVIGLSQYWEESGRHENAVECLRKGMETDNLAEEFYQRLMVCYQQLGQEAEAVRVYQRCSAVFSAAMGIAPSARTEAIYKALITRT